MYNLIMPHHRGNAHQRLTSKFILMDQTTRCLKGLLMYFNVKQTEGWIYKWSSYTEFTMTRNHSLLNYVYIIK